MKPMKIAVAALSATLLFNQAAFASRNDCPAAADQQFGDFKRFVLARGGLDRELDAAFESVSPAQSESAKKTSLENFVKSRNAEDFAWCSQGVSSYICETENPPLHFIQKRDSIDASFAFNANSGELTLCVTKSIFPPVSQDIYAITYDDKPLLPIQAEYKIQSCRTDAQGKAGPVSTRATMIVWSMHDNGGPKYGATLSGADIGDLNQVAVQLYAEMQNGDYTCRRPKAP